MRVLVACEMSGRVRDAFITRGHDAISCDLIPSLTPGPHIVGDVRELLSQSWDMLIAFPPCTYLSNAGAQYWPRRSIEQAEALEFVSTLWHSEIRKIAIENPRGRISRVLGPASQWINPWEFGEPYTKLTGLWLKRLTCLKPTVRTEPNNTVPWVGGKNGRQRVMVSGAAPKQNRSITFQCIATAMAREWG